MLPSRTHHAGASVEDFCRACKTDRTHTIIVVDEHKQLLRVTCDYCESQHNYRGGPRIDARDHEGTRRQDGGGQDSGGQDSAADNVPEPVRPRERTALPVTPLDSPLSTDTEALLRRIIREEAGLTPVTPAAKWRGGTLVLRPGAPGLQEKTWPIDTFFHKLVMLRNRLRTLEQQVNASELPDDVKVKLQGYVSGCYGSLTSFNVLFADADDQFKGAAGD